VILLTDKSNNKKRCINTTSLAEVKNGIMTALSTTSNINLIPL